MIFRIVLLSAILCVSVSCNNRNVRKEVVRMINSEITIPHLYDAIFNGKDTVMHISEDAYFRMIILFDSTFCAYCHFPEMEVWNELILYSTATISKFVPIFIFCPGQGKVSALKLTLKQSHFKWPLFIDENDEFLKRNTVIPQDSRYHTFLLNSENRIVLVGNPVGNDALWALYKKVIEQ